jgi:hypothetical protein
MGPEEVGEGRKSGGSVSFFLAHCGTTCEDKKLKGDNNKTQQLNLSKSSQERFVFMEKIKPKGEKIWKTTCEEDKAQR